MAGNANKVNITAGLFKAFAHESITVTDTAQTFTAATYLTGSEKAKRAIITIESAQIRYTYDGTTPTSSVGHLCNPFDVISLIGSDNITNFRAIRAGSTNAAIKVTYEN